MDDELKKLLEENIKISQETLSILKKIQRDILIRRIFSLIKWAIIIGFLVFGFIKFQKYIDTLIERYQTVFQAIDQIKLNLPR